MSQFKVNGLVSSVSTKTKSTRMGDKIIHYATVDGQEFSTGFKQPFNDGQMVNCLVEHKYGEYQLVEGVTPTNQPLLGSAPPPAPAGGKKFFGGGGGRPASKFPVEPTDGQMSIIRQNSMNRAVEIVKHWTDSGIFKAKSEEDYLSKLIEVAVHITDFNSGQDIMKYKAAVQQLNQGKVA